MDTSRRKEATSLWPRLPLQSFTKHCFTVILRNDGAVKADETGIHCDKVAESQNEVKVSPHNLFFFCRWTFLFINVDSGLQMSHLIVLLMFSCLCPFGKHGHFMWTKVCQWQIWSILYTWNTFKRTVGVHLVGKTSWTIVCISQVAASLPVVTLSADWGRARLELANQWWPLFS